MKNEEAAIDPAATGLGFLDEFLHGAIRKADLAEAGLWMNGGDGRVTARGLVRSVQRAHIDIAHVNTVNGQEDAVAKITRGAFDPGPCVGIPTGIRQDDRPILSIMGIENLRVVACQMDGDIGLMVAIVQEVISNDMALVPEANDKLFYPKRAWGFMIY